MVRMAPHRGGVAKRRIAPENHCIELKRQSKATKRIATAKNSKKHRNVRSSVQQRLWLAVKSSATEEQSEAEPRHGDARQFVEMQRQGFEVNCCAAALRSTDRQGNGKEWMGLAAA